MSNKTHAKHADATESAPDTKQRSSFRLLVAGGLIIFGLMLVLSGVRGLTVDSGVLEAPGGSIRIERVVRPADRQRGLSGREHLDMDAGMLFVFDDSSPKHCLWMKDMKISIDMVWIDSRKKVLNVAENVSPETFPEAFCPDGEALYALELAVGQARKYGIKAGEGLSF